MLVDEGDHFLNGRSSSAWVKNANALRGISFAWRSSLTSRSSALIRSRSSVVGLGACPGRVRPAGPSPARFRRAADLCRDRADRRPMRGVIALMLEHHPYRVLANLGEVFRRCFLRHGSSLSKSGPLAGPVRLTVNLLETVTQIL